MGLEDQCMSSLAPASLALAHSRGCCPMPPRTSGRRSRVFRVVEDPTFLAGLEVTRSLRRRRSRLVGGVEHTPFVSALQIPRTLHGHATGHLRDRLVS
jgi:hypothetical protein